jgi:MarR family transcriptional regulator for hemolysin
MGREVRFAFLIHDVSRLRRVLFNRIARELGTSQSQWWVLASLSRDDGFRQADLAGELDVGSVSLGGLLERLEQAGMIVRRGDPLDRRVKLVYLTRAARRLVRQNQELDKRVNGTTLYGVSPADFKITMRTLEKMKSNLLAAMAGGVSVELEHSASRTNPRRGTTMPSRGIV